MTVPEALALPVDEPDRIDSVVQAKRWRLARCTGRGEQHRTVPVVVWAIGSYINDDGTLLAQVVAPMVRGRTAELMFPPPGWDVLVPVDEWYCPRCQAPVHPDAMQLHGETR